MEHLLKILYYTGKREADVKGMWASENLFLFQLEDTEYVLIVEESNKRERDNNGVEFRES